ncbi:MAG: DUF1579 domain-containing protein [Phycisphaerales bacterium]|nr:DUF1579 domain-containing protein [Phycisphaerales bacterium]
MLCPKTVAVAAAALLLGAAGATVLSEPAQPAAPSKPALPSKPEAKMPGEMNPEEMMKKMMENTSPGPQHKAMAVAIGSWDLQATMWDQPGGSPQKNTGTAEIKAIMGGRYLVESVKMEAFEMPGGMKVPFEGMNISGYDNMKKKYVFSWIDSMATGILHGEGEADASGKVITYFAECLDPMTGMPAKYKNVCTHESPDRITFEMHTLMPDGKWFKNFVLEYTRRK